MGIRVLIADDHRMVREGLKMLLEKMPGLSVTAEAEDGVASVEAVKKNNIDIAIMDISMPNLNGIEAVRQIKTARPNTRIIILSMHSDKRFVIEAMKAGADGYLLKDSAFEEMALAIGAVMKGQRYLSRETSDLLANEYLNGSKHDPSAVYSVLTAREREVLQLLTEGRSTKQIALKLAVSIKTVETHRQQIMRKTGINSLAGLTKYAIKEGLTNL